MFNSSLSSGQAALAFCLPGATSCMSYLMTSLEIDLAESLPIGQVQVLVKLKKLLGLQQNLLVLNYQLGPISNPVKDNGPVI